MNSKRGLDSFVRATAGMLLLIAGGAVSCGGDDTSLGAYGDGGETRSDADGAARRDDGTVEAHGGEDAGRDASGDAMDGAAGDAFGESADRSEETGASDASVGDISVGDESTGTPDVSVNRGDAENNDASLDGGPQGDVSTEVVESGSGETSAVGDEAEVDASADTNLTEADVNETGSPGSFYSCSPPEGAVPPLATEIVAQGLAEPVGIEASLHDLTRLYILEKGGKVRLMKNGVLLDRPFLDISNIVWHESEAGLLGLAFHPDYEKNGRFWAYYTVYKAPGSFLAEFHRSEADADVADPTPVGGAPIFGTMLSYIHQGGALEFGSDGNLYLGLGERGTEQWAQDLQLHIGKILRFDVTTYPYSIPPGNMPNALPEIWDTGLRNPWRISFDLCTGVLYIGDVGGVLREEIDIEPPGTGNRNYGWPITEGSICKPLGMVCNTSGFTMPAMEHSHDVSNVIIGGYVYRGSRIPALRSRYIYSDIGGNFFWLTQNGGAVTNSGSLDVPPVTGVLVSFGQDAAGELYTAQVSAGTVRRLVPR